MARVSVIVPNYNHAKFLDQRLDSILNQSYQDFELLLLDDASTDRSLAVLEKYRNHPKVTFFSANANNSGSPFKQWKAGVDHAQGEYIWVAESDDFASIDFLKEAVTHLEEGADIVYTRSYVVDERGSVDDGYYWADVLDPRRWKSDHCNQGITEIADYLAYQNTIPNASACVFKRDRFRLPTSITNMKYCGDWLFWVTYLRNARLQFISRPLNYHRRHSQTTRTTKDLKSEITRLREYWTVIMHARSLTGKGAIKPHELGAYRWIFEEMFQKRRTIGLRGIFNSLPALLYPYYLFFHFKKAVYNAVKG